MKKIVLIALVLLVTVGCGDDWWYNEEEAIQKAYALVEQDCSPAYSWYGLPIDVYEANFWDGGSLQGWVVNVGAAPKMIFLFDSEDPGNEPIKGLVMWNSVTGHLDTQGLIKQYLKYCSPNTLEYLQ